MASSNSQPGLADLIDLELQLLKLEQGDPLAVQAAQAVEPQQPAWPSAAQWLEQLQARGAALPGARVEMGIRAAGLLLSLLGFFMGASACAAALAYNGAEPINLWQFLGWFVLLQVLLLVLLLVALSTSLLRGGAWLSLAQRLLLAIARSRWIDHALGRISSAEWRQQWQQVQAGGARLRSRHALYHNSERWLLLQLTQRFGIFFNLGALLVFAGLVLFTDLAFAWSTTPAGIEGHHLEVVCRLLGAPFAWLGNGVVPDLRAIEATRWSHLQHAFADPVHGPQAAAAWWPFLLLALFTWGFLPRLLAWTWAGRALRRSLREARLDHAGFQKLYQIVNTPATTQWSGPAPEIVAGELLASVASAPTFAATAQKQDLRTAQLVLWGGWQATTARLKDLLQRYGWSVETTTEAGGAVEAASRALVQAAAQHSTSPYVILVEGGESPDKRLLRLLRDLRASLAPHTPIVVGLSKYADGKWAPILERELQLWRAYLTASHDPYLQVEAWSQ